MNRITDYSKLATDISKWIKDYATSNNIQSLVVGVSGGIDSAVVSTICARTGLPVYCYSIGIDRVPRLALEHMNWMRTIYPNSYTGTVNWKGDYIRELFYAGSDHAWANTQSRLRMTFLYHRAVDLNGIVVGTGNKVEDLGIGFFTKYGDGGVDISPIADLYKTEVRELGRYLGISQEIIDVQPTDGLWVDGRTDEDQIGCTYEELEWAMEYIAIPNFDSRGYLDLDKRERQVVDIYTNLYMKNQHKMQPIPTFKI